MMTYQAHHDEAERDSTSTESPERPPSAEPVLYYTTRPFGWSLAAQALPMLLVAPMVLVAPETAGVIVATALLMAWWTRRSFLFELTETRMRFRPGPFLDAREVPLTSIDEVQPLNINGSPLNWGRRAVLGHLKVTLRGGETLVMAGINDPVESAEALMELRRRSVEGAAADAAE